MDGLIHTVSIAQFGDALLQHTFPIIWLNNFANYGLPVGLFSHQLPIYLGALLDLVFKNPVLSTNSISLLGVMLTNLLFYKFLRIYFLPRGSFFATLLFALAPYRILNAYIRGATPETFSLFFLPLILINLHGLIVKRRIHSFFFLTLSCAGLALTHPMMLVIYSFFIIPYLIFLLFSQKDKAGKSALAAFVIPTFASLLAALLSLGIAGYYYLPLFLEKKYFYFGMSTNLLNESFLGLQNFIGTKWYYFYGNDIFTRGHVLQVGFLETMLLVVGVVLLIKEFFQKKKSESYYLLLVTSFVGVAVVVLLLPFSRPIYGFLSILQSIQFPENAFC
jgi:uncharacterized membrane protein